MKAASTGTNVTTVTVVHNSVQLFQPPGLIERHDSGNVMTMSLSLSSQSVVHELVKGFTAAADEGFAAGGLMFVEEDDLALDAGPAAARVGLCRSGSVFERITVRPLPPPSLPLSCPTSNQFGADFSSSPYER